jgi:hypothetical protein
MQGRKLHAYSRSLPFRLFLHPPRNRPLSQSTRHQSSLPCRNPRIFTTWIQRIVKPVAEPLVVKVVTWVRTLAYKYYKTYKKRNPRAKQIKTAQICANLAQHS